MTLDVERVTINVAESILGLKRRNIQAKSARGEIPGAAKIGGLWTYNLAKLRGYVEQEEERQWQQSVRRHRPVATGAAIPCGAALSSMVVKSDGRYKQITRRLRQSGGKRGKSAR
jgi:hypothetical protein